MADSLFLVGLGRVELPTSPLSGVRSSHLSYRPMGVCYWWSWSGSNRRPPECKSGALPAELQPRFFIRGRLDAATPRHCLEISSETAELQVEIRTRLIAGNRSCLLPLEWNGCQRLALAPPTFSLRKEVIQPQVLLRLPCYDFTPIMSHTLGRCLPCGSACRLLVQPTFVM